MMNAKKFDYDEMAIVAIYKANSTEASIAKMQEALPYIDDKDMKVLVEQVIEKIKHVTNVEYHALNLNEFDFFLFEEDIEND